MDKDKKNIQQINIELDEKISSGEYANFVVVTHSPAEFVMDFTRPVSYTHLTLPTIYSV